MVWKRFFLSAFAVLVSLSLYGCGGSSAPISIAVTAASSTVDATDSVTLSVAVTHDKNAAGVSWAVSGGGALSGTSTTAATYTAPASSTTALTVTVTATSIADPKQSGTATITVPAAPTIATASLTAGTVGTAYSLTLAGSGGISPYSFSITSGTLPAGLTMTSAGAITGTPLAGGVGTTNLTFQMTDSGKATPLTATASLALTINAAPAIVFPTTLAAGTYNVAYTASVAATGGAGTLTYTLASGALPTGLALSAAGAISGTPTVVGTFPITVKATDAFGDSGTQAFSLKVSYPALTITPPTLPTGYVGSTYTSTTLAATGGSGTGFTFAVTSGSSLPAGLSLSAAGVITGKPTAVGTVSTSVTVTDSASNTGSATLSFTIKAAVSITTPTTLPLGYVGGAYSQTLAATGGSGAGYTWAVSSGSTLPGGLALSAAGVLSGKPTATGTPTFGVTVTDSASNTASATFSLTVSAGVSITTPLALPAGFVGANYSQTLAATGGSGTGFTWAVTSGSTLPAGLTLSTAGVLSGKPTTAGTPTFSVTVTDSVSNTANATFSLTIHAGVGIITPATLPTGYVGAIYSQTLTAGGGSGTGYTWAITAGESTLTAVGLSMTNAGLISGTPGATGTASFTVSVTDSASNTASGTFTLVVNPAVSITTPSPLPAGYSGSAYSQTLVAVGGSGTGYTWTVTAGSASLAAVNLSLSSGGVLSGTPAATGAPSFTVKVTDSASNSATATFSLTVGVGVTITTPTTLGAGYQGTAYPTTTLAASGGTGSGYTWSWAAASGSSLPAGLSLSAAGVISGTPSASGNFSMVITVKDSAQNTSAATFSLNVVTTLTITTGGTLKTGVVNTLYSQPLAATGGSGGNTWTVTAGAASLTAVNLTLSSGGILSGTPAAPGTANFTAKVTDANSHSATATFAVTINASLAVSTVSLPSGYTSAAYSQTLAASGGTGTPYTWSVVAGGNLATFNLSLSPAGVLSGTPAVTGTVNFTAQVMDSASNTATAPFSFVIYNPLTLPGTNPGSLPAGLTGVNYSGTVSANGGSGNYAWTVTGFPSDGLNYSTAGGTLTVTGKPTAAATVTFTAAVKDTTTNATVGPNTYTIAVTNPAPLLLPAANPASLPSATVSQSYGGTVNATGGVPPYTWMVNGNPVATNGTQLALSNGLYVTNDGSLALTVGGTPTTIGSTVTFTAQITDSISASSSQVAYTVAVNAAGSQVSGHIDLTNNCGGITLPQMTLSINTSPVQTTNTDSSGNYSFASIPNGTYTITPSISGPSSLFYPATLTNVVVNNTALNQENILASLGYTVSGTVGYGGAQTGQVYVSLNSNNCGGNPLGISISAAGAFTIRGVPPGAYTLSSWMDTLGFGYANASDPSGSTSPLDVSNANISGASVTMTDPAAYTLTSGPSLDSISPIDQGAVISFGAITTHPSSGNKVELPTSYTIQWSTSSTFTSPASYNIKAGGANGTGVWFLSNSIPSLAGKFSNSTPYFFRASGNVGAVAGPWTVYGGGTPLSVTIGAPTGGSTVSGAITFSATPTGPLYVGFFDNNTGFAYGTRIASPVSPQNYTVQVPNGTNYFFFVILDQNNNGVIDPGDITNTGGNNDKVPYVVSGNQTANFTLAPAGSTASVTTQHWKQTSSGITGSGFNLNFNVRAGTKLPVSVTLMSGPHVINPIDMGKCADCGSNQFQYYVSIGGTTPAVNDAYGFKVTYSDGTSETVTGLVTAVLNAFATNLAPTTGSSTLTQPTFTWTDPASASSYTYQFYISDNNGNQIWQIPGNNSKSNGFSSSITSITWGTDPTGDSSNTPSQSSLTTGTQYNWQIQLQDSNGNSTQTQVNYIP